MRAAARRVTTWCEQAMDRQTCAAVRDLMVCCWGGVGTLTPLRLRLSDIDRKLRRQFMS